MALDVLTSIDLDLLSPRLVTVHAKQYDISTRRIKVTLWQGDSKWIAPSGVIGVISYLKPDGNVGFYDETDLGEQAVTFDVSDRSIITLILSTQSLTCDGSVKMEVNFYEPSRSRRLSTFSFILQVERSTITDDDLHSSSEFRILAEEIQQILDAVGSIAGITATGKALPAGATPTVTVTGGGGVSDPYNLEFGIPKFNGITASKTALAPGQTPTVQVSGGTATSPYNLAFGLPAFPGVTATASKLPQGSQPTATVTGGTTATTPYNIAFGIPGGSGITNIAYSYGSNTSQTTPPTTWYPNIADVVVADGGWLWQKAVATYGDGETETYYMKGKQGPPGPTSVAVQDTQPDGSYLLWIDPNEAQTIVIPDIKDNVVALDSTYSSSKINSLVSGKTEIKDNVIATNSTYSSSKIEDLVGSGTAVANVVAPEYTSGRPYAVGDIVIHDGYLYVCYTAIPSSGAWDITKWIRTTVGYELASLDTKFTDVVANNFVPNASYSVGDYVIHGSYLYVCKEDHTAGSSFDSSKWFKTWVSYHLNSLAEDIAVQYSPGTTYGKGTYVLYDPSGVGPKLYRCNVNTSSTTWVSSEWRNVSIGDVLYDIASSGSSAAGAVKYTEAQSLTESQQQQVYANLGFPNNTLAKLSYTVVS